jgi:anthranilate/para-aminobenzoate synthase component I
MNTNTSWKDEAAAFKTLDKILPALLKAGLRIYFDTKGKLHVCCQQGTHTKKDLLKNKKFKALLSIDRIILKEYLRVQQVIYQNGGMYMPGGYITYTYTTKSDYRNGIYETDKIGQLIVDVPEENLALGDEVKLTISHEIKKSDAIKALTAILHDLKNNDTFNRLKKEIQKIETEFELKACQNDVVKAAKLIKKGELIEIEI